MVRPEMTLEPRPDAGGPPHRAGLCVSCTHVDVVTSSRGSTFYLCRLSETDPRFRKYPVLPVLRCSGYEFLPPAIG
jgi:hypothetical protein